MRDPLMSWNVRVLDPVLRKALPWMYGMSENAIRWFLFGLASFILGWAGRRFYTKAWSALVHKTADMNTLVALGTGAAFLYSAAGTISPGFLLAHGIVPDVYFEAAILIVGLVLTGNALESRAKGQTAIALRKLVELQPKTATVLQNGMELDLPVESIREGDTILVRPGQRIPTDGRVDFRQERSGRIHAHGRIASSGEGSRRQGDWGLAQSEWIVAVSCGESGRGQYTGADCAAAA